MKRIFSRPAIILGLVLAAVLAVTACTGGPSLRGWSGPAVGKNGVVYVGGMDGTVYAVNPTARASNTSFPDSSQAEWAYPIKAVAKASGFGCSPGAVSVAFYGPPLVSTDGAYVYVATYEGKVYGLSAKGGVDPVLWTCPNPDSGVTFGNLIGAPVLYNNLLLITSADGHIYGITATGDERGKLAYQFPARDAAPLGRIWTTPAVSGDVAYFGTFSGEGYAISLKDFRPVWSQPIKLTAAIASVAASGNLVVFGSFDDKLYAYDTQKGGDPLWTAQAGNWFWSPPLVTADAVYAGNLDGGLYAFNPRTGAETWKAAADSSVGAAPQLSGTNIVFVSQAGTIYIVRKDGTPVKTIPVGAAVLSTPSISGNTIYLSTTDQKLYAVDLTTGASTKYSLTPAAS